MDVRVYGKRNNNVSKCNQIQTEYDERPSKIYSDKIYKKKARVSVHAEQFLYLFERTYIHT